MALPEIIIGLYPNDGTGDDLRTAFQKVNQNFAALEASDVVNGENLGTGVGIFAQKGNMQLQFKSLTSLDNSVTITSTPNTINLQTSTIGTDPSPTLAGNLDLNGFYTFNGDTQTTVYGIDVRVLSSILSLLTQSNQVPVDMGNFLNPVQPNLDMGPFIGDHYTGDQLDFGSF